MEYAVKILDKKGTFIGELPTASPDDILKLIGKGFTVVDMRTEQPITPDEIASTVGISESVMGVY